MVSELLAEAILQERRLNARPIAHHMGASVCPCESSRKPAAPTITTANAYDAIIAFCKKKKKKN